MNIVIASIEESGCLDACTRRIEFIRRPRRTAIYAGKDIVGSTNMCCSPSKTFPPMMRSNSIRASHVRISAISIIVGTDKDCRQTAWSDEVRLSYRHAVYRAEPPKFELMIPTRAAASCCRLTTTRAAWAELGTTLISRRPAVQTHAVITQHLAGRTYVPVFQSLEYLSLALLIVFHKRHCVEVPRTPQLIPWSYRE